MRILILNSKKEFGGLAQLARAPALHAGGHRFDSDILHYLKKIENRKQKIDLVYYLSSLFYHLKKKFIDILRYNKKVEKILELI